MAASLRPVPESEELQQAPEELQDLQVRVVRLSELGAKAAPTALDETPPVEARPSPEGLARAAPQARSAPQPQARPTPQPQGRSTPQPQARPTPQPQARSTPQPQARTAPQPQAHPAPQPQARSAPQPSPTPPARSRELAAPSPTAALAPSPARTPAPSPARTPAPSPTALPELDAPTRGRLISSRRLSLVLVTAILYYGWTTHTERYINPYRGFGYALGIIGGSLMLVLLAYSLRKRWAWLEFMGSTPSWFKFHMVLGIAGPVAILYHSNFSTGATNSNVALFSMLTVAGSGVIGRYIYSHIHNGLYGRKLELGEVRAGAETLRSLSGRISFVPELVTRLESAEQRVLKAGPQLSVLGFARPLAVGLATLRVRGQLHRYIRRSLHASSRKSAVVRTEEKRLRQCARAYVDRRLAATRRVAAFEGYERLFSLWHSLHIPLIFVMVIAAIIHVIAVHIY